MRELEKIAEKISEAGKKIATGIVVVKSLTEVGPALYDLYDKNRRPTTPEERREEFNMNVAKRIISFYNAFDKGDE